MTDDATHSSRDATDADRADDSADHSPNSLDRPVVACVFAGGVGTRLYPAVRSDRPKQFLAPGGGKSLLARTIARTGFADRVVVVTRAEFADRVAEIAPNATVVVEPRPLDTGPAALFAAEQIRQRTAGDVEPVIVTTPADHAVPDHTAFERAMRRGARVAAETDSLVTFGVEPTRPETGYGYVQPGTDHGEYATVATFHEKPDAATAREYVAAGYYWNAGLFAWTPSALFAAARNTPLADTATALANDDPDRAYAIAPETGVERGVLEHAADRVVVPVSFPWDDLGAWDALARQSDVNGSLGADDTASENDAGGATPTESDAENVQASENETVRESETETTEVSENETVRESETETTEASENGNTTVSLDLSPEAGDDATSEATTTEPRTVTIDATNTLIAGDHHVSLVGVEDLCVVAVEDRVLVVPRDDTQRVRQLVGRLRERGEF